MYNQRCILSNGISEYIQLLYLRNKQKFVPLIFFWLGQLPNVGKYSKMLFLLRPLKLLGYVPLKSAARKGSRILCDVRFVVNNKNVERSLVLKLLQEGFEDGALQDADDMIEFMKPRPSARVQSVRQAVSTISVPVFAVVGSADVQCPAVDALESAQLLPGPLTICQLGKDFGCKEEYGHFDCLLGTRAETELFAPLDEWLRTHASEAL